MKDPYEKTAWEKVRQWMMSSTSTYATVVAVAVFAIVLLLIAVLILGFHDSDWIYLRRL